MRTARITLLLLILCLAGVVAVIRYPFDDSATPPASGPTPEPTCEDPIFYLSFRSDLVSIIRAYSTTGTLLDSYTTSINTVRQIVPDGAGGVLVPNQSGNDPISLDSALDFVWEWTRPSNSETYMAPDGAGGAYVAITDDSNDSHIYHVNSSGSGTLLATIEGEKVFSLLLSEDESTLFGVFDAFEFKLRGFDASDGSELWDMSPGTSTGFGGRLARKPGSDVLFVGFTDGSGVDSVPSFARIEFPGGDVTLEPSVAATGSDTAIGAASAALAVTTTAVYLGRTADYGAAPGVLTAFTHAGVLLWRLEGEDFEPDESSVRSVASINNLVLVGLDTVEELFTSGDGFVLLDALTGAPVTAGAFPLESTAAGEVAAACLPGDIGTS